MSGFPAQVRFLLQSPDSPPVFEPFARLVLDPSVSRLRAAVAFATTPGVRLLEGALGRRTPRLPVEIVVGLDGHITEPNALSRLLEAPDIALRVFASGATTMFHPKVYFFDAAEVAVAIVGSCNLSAAGLTRNRESAVQVWLEAGSAAAEEWERWWREIWTLSRPLDQQLLESYSAGYSPQRRSPSDIQSVDTPEPVEVPLDQADRLWLGTSSMTGGGVTQLELPRDTVRFFGVTPDSHVEVIELTLRRGGEEWGANRLAFYENNDMWRINLNGEIPEVRGRSLPYQYVLFIRTGEPGVYQFLVLGEPETAELRAAAGALGQFGQTRTRDFGWL